jgi:hypothetical protein
MNESAHHRVCSVFRPVRCVVDCVSVSVRWLDEVGCSLWAQRKARGQWMDERGDCGCVAHSSISDNDSGVPAAPPYISSIVD